MRVWLQTGALVVAGLLFGALPACAAAHPVQVCVHDQAGSAIAGARLQVSSLPQAVVSDASGCATVNVETQETVEVTKEGFSRVEQVLGSESQSIVVMQVAGAVEEVDVTAARSPLALDAS